MASTALGDQELALLREVAEGGAGTVAELVERFGAPRKLARSTVLTMLERLREKGRLTRRREGGVFRYQAREGVLQILGGAVDRFMGSALGGSLSPFAAWLAEREDVSDAELAELEQALDRLKARRREDGVGKRLEGSGDREEGQ